MAVAAPLAVVATTGILWYLLRRTTRRGGDWAYSLRLTVTLNRIAMLDNPNSACVIAEVLIEAVAEHSSCRELRLVSADQPRRSWALTLDQPAEGCALLCTGWRAQGTLLLLVSDGDGAVLHGPEGCLFGKVTDDPVLRTLAADHGVG
jgi:hypothetical protein